MRLADKITLLRVFLIPLMVIFAVLGYKLIFISILLLILLGDIFDGYIARKEDGGTKKGALWDSYADFILGLAIIFLSFFLFWDIYLENKWSIFFLLVMIAIPFIFSFLKFRRVPEYHLISNKINTIGGYAFFIFTLFFGFRPIFLYVVILILSLNTTEKVILILQGKMNAEIKSIFWDR